MHPVLSGLCRVLFYRDQDTHCLLQTRAIEHAWYTLMADLLTPKCRPVK